MLVKKNIVYILVKAHIGNYEYLLPKKTQEPYPIGIHTKSTSSLLTNISDVDQETPNQENVECRRVSIIHGEPSRLSYFLNKTTFMCMVLTIVTLVYIFIHTTRIIQFQI